MQYTDLIGKTFVSVVNNGNEELIFTADTGEVYKFFHDQNCCEDVYIESIVGELSDLVGSPILTAEVETNEDLPSLDESYTWTFYKFSTRKGYVDVRWYGTSNGYYSESVDFEQVK